MLSLSLSLSFVNRQFILQQHAYLVSIKVIYFLIYE
jgi:hypothetical protein